MSGSVLKVLILLATLIPSASLASELSLEDCLRLAKADSPIIKTARLEKSIADQQVRQADSTLFPRVDLQGGYTAQLEAQAVKYNNQAMQMQQPTYLFANLAINQTIYDFGRRDALRGQSKVAVTAVENSILATEQELSLHVIETYFAILASVKLGLSAMDDLKTVEEHRKVAGIFFENGAVTRNDLLQAEVKIASAKQKLLSISTREKNLRLRLNYLTGLPPENNQPLKEPNDTEPIVSKENHGLHELSKRPDIRMLNNKVEASQYMVEENRRHFYPELFARLSMDYLQNDRVREQAIYAATLGLRVNLFDGFSTSASLQRSVASRARLQQQLKQAEEEARLELATAVNDLNVAGERIVVARSAISQAEENLRINRNRYQERVGTATEVLDAQALLSQSRAEYYNVWFDYQVAVARVRKAKGDSL